MDSLNKKIALIEQQLNVTFQDKDLLMQAFVHKSYLNEHETKLGDNERLEFLGDSILYSIVTFYLFGHFKTLSEGKLSYIRSNLICKEANALYLQQLDLGSYLLTGKGEKSRESTTLFANLFEAILGALFLDQGYDQCNQFFLDHFTKTMQQIIEKPIENFKAELQHYAQTNFNQKPLYRVQKEVGAQHQKEFFVQVFIDDRELGLGVGKNKKQAEQLAAKNALENIKEIEK
jgi:ribonuclease-3